MHVVRKEFLELRQDPRLFGIVIMAPIVQLTMLGYAATTDVRNVPLVVVDQDGSSESRELVSRFEASQNFMVDRPRCRRSSEIDAYLDTGRAWMALTIPADYGERVRTGDADRPCRSWPTAPTRTRPTSRSAMPARLIADYARELAAASGLASPARRSSPPRCASGSTRSSRAATS